jgi:hypothetical protein
MRLWRLDRIVSIDLLDRGFARREDFYLVAYPAQSFGVFQEEPIDVNCGIDGELALHYLIFNNDTTFAQH